MSRSNQIIISGIISGNKDAYLKLYDSYYKPLCKFAFKYVRSIEGAEDVVQDTFAKMWNLRKSLSQNSNIVPYLYQAVKNNALDYIRSAIKEKELRRNLIIRAKFAEPKEFATHYEADELYYSVVSVLKTIPEKTREVFELSRYHGLKYKEIAQKLDITIKGVEYHMTKALKHLEKELNNYLNAI